MLFVSLADTHDITVLKLTHLLSLLCIAIFNIWPLKVTKQQSSLYLVTCLSEDYAHK
jgi:hypothetical protein